MPITLASCTAVVNDNTGTSPHVSAQFTTELNDIVSVWAFVFEVGSGHPTINGITLNGVSMTENVTIENDSQDSRLSNFSKDGVAASTTNTISIAHSANSAGLSYVIKVWRGGPATAALDGAGVIDSASGVTAASGNKTPSANDAGMCGAFGSETGADGGSITALDSFTLDASDAGSAANAGRQFGTSHRENVGTTGPFNARYTIPTAAWIAGLVAFKSGAGGTAVLDPATATEAEVVAGGKVLTLTLTGDTFISN